MSVDRWVDIYSDLRVWAGAHEVHKMNWLRAGDRIHLSAQYGSWFRFDNVVGGADLRPFDDDYDEYWVKGDELELVVTSSPPESETEPAPDPESEDRPSDTEIGRVIRFLHGR